MTKLAFLALVMLGAVSSTGQSHAQVTSTEQRNRTIYASRGGDREADPNNANLNGDRRVNKRIDTRIDSRLRTRIDKFTVPAPDYKNSYNPVIDDGTKSKEK